MIDPELNTLIMERRQFVGVLLLLSVGVMYIALASLYDYTRHTLPARASPHKFVRPEKKWRKP